MKHLQTLENKQDYQTLIQELKKLVSKDKRVFTDPYVKEWCGRRWRNFFLQEAILDGRALHKASYKGFKKNKDNRPPLQKIADRYIKGDVIGQELDLQMPEAKIGEVKHTTLIFCPGFVNGFFPKRALQTEFTELEQTYGVRVVRADAHPLRSSEANMEDLLLAINEGRGFTANAKTIAKSKAIPPGDIFVIGYSKGMTDLLTLLIHYPEIKNRIRCIFSVAGAIGGSYNATDWHKIIENFDLEQVESALGRLLPMFLPEIQITKPLRRLDEYDTRGALNSMSTKTRTSFNKKYAATIDAMNIPIFQITAATTALEVPLINLKDYLSISRYDANNDMQLTQEQQKMAIPMAIDLAMVRAHHLDVANAPLPKNNRRGSPNLDHPFPRKALVVAIFKLAVELGLID